MRVLIASDHAGFDLKETLKASPLAEWIDLGPKDDERVDYPDFAKRLCEEFLNDSDHLYDFAVLVCGSGQGMAITANKFQNIRAALVWNNEIAALARGHNDANVLCLPSRFISSEEALDFTKIFFTTEFEGGRHLDRVNKIED